MDLDEDETLYTRKLIQPVNDKNRIVLCGSKKVQEDIIRLAKLLKSLHFEVIVPKEFFDDLDKYIATKEHISQIIDDKTYAILVVNNKAYDKDNYIGANTFVEIAFAFYYNKKVYLLNDIYKPYKEELDGWNVKCCNGKLNRLIKDTL